MEIPNILICEGRLIYAVVEGRQPLCWAFGVVRHLTKASPGQNPEPQSKRNVRSDRQQHRQKKTTNAVQGCWRLDRNPKEAAAECKAPI